MSLFAVVVLVAAWACSSFATAPRWVVPTLILVGVGLALLVKRGPMVTTR